MTPILFNATTKVNNSEGLGRLTDAISCVVTEERNGSYELTMTYPVTGQHYEDIEIRYQIVTSAFKGSGKQAFRIYKISKPLNGVVTINARHISYDLKNIVVSPFTASTCAQALTNLSAAMQVANDFEFWTNKSVAANFQLKHPDTVRNVLGGSAGSILDIYGTGEYEFDNYDVKLWLHRGSDKGVTIRYGKNLTDVKATMDSGNVYTTIVPYWVSQDGSTVVNGDPVYSEHETEVPGHSTVAMDFSAEFTEAPTKAALMTKAAQYLEANKPWEISENLTISFVALADTEEYKDVASLETVNLCDTVHVYHPKLGITATAKVVRTKWDSLRERYDEIELGTPKTTLSQAIAPVTKTDLTRQATQTSNFLLDSMAELIEALTGASGGHVIFHREADGHVSEIYIMDTDDAATATNVLRINYLGIYASTTGINGTYNLAITTGGTINANQIMAGVLQGIEVITDTGNIGGWEITADGLQRETTINGVKYRAVLRPPNLNSGVDTWIVSTQYYNEETQTWRARAFITAEGSARFDGDYMYVNTSSESHFGTEYHSGTESHSGTETHSGNVTLSGSANVIRGISDMRINTPVSIYSGGIGYSNATATFVMCHDAFGNDFWTPAYNKNGSLTVENGTYVQGEVLGEYTGSSWTDNMTMDLDPGLWLIEFGCQIQGVGAITCALYGADGNRDRASVYAPDGNYYTARGSTVIGVSTTKTIKLQTWSSTLTSIRYPVLYAVKIGGI